MQYLNDCLDPVEHHFHVGVNTWLSLPGTANTPAHYAYQIPTGVTDMHQRASTVPLTFKIHFKNEVCSPKITIIPRIQNLM